jgi:decaprenyl-phosphate phosphoribosyltransferase
MTTEIKSLDERAAGWRSHSSARLGARVDRLPPALRLLRPHQWVKNGFVAAPLFFTPWALSAENIALVFAGVCVFSLIASAAYILNDCVDYIADRQHPLKRTRPIASGEISRPSAMVLLGALLAAGLTIAFLLSFSFGALAVIYFAVNVAYSSWLKNISILDVMTITFGFVLRVMAGATLIQVQPSVWIIICTGLVALFLALAKRRDDLAQALGPSHRAALAGYTKQFLDTSIAIVLGALIIAYIMYTTDEEVMRRLKAEELYLTVPFVLAGVLRYLQISLVEERSGAPTLVVLTDRFLAACILLWAASFGLLIYL